MRILLAVGVCALLMAATCSAAVVFQEDFAGYAPGTYNSNFGPWNLSGSVDVVGGQFFSELCYGPNNQCVDTDGSSTQPGNLSTILDLTPGQYLLSFRLGGSQRPDGSNTIRVWAGSSSWDLTRANNAPHQIVTWLFQSTGGPTTIRFEHLSTPDYQGLMLDDILVESTVPEPGTLGLLGIGGLLVAYSKFRKR